MHEGRESSEVIVARNFFNYSSLALLNDDIDNEWEDGLEWIADEERRQEEVKEAPHWKPIAMFPPCC